MESSSSYTLKKNCSICYIEDYLSASDLAKIQKYLSSFPKNKQIYCRFWIRGLCIFSPSVCPHSHGSDFEYIEPSKRTKDNTFFHVNTDKSLKFDAYSKKSLPIYLLLPQFQQELLEDKLIEKEEVLTQAEFDTNFEKRYKIRGIYQKREGLKFVNLLFRLSKDRNFFLTRIFIENEIRRVKLNKMNMKLPEILQQSPDLIMIGALIPPLLKDPTEIVVFKKEASLFQEFKIAKARLFYLKETDSKEERDRVISEYLEEIPLNKAIFCDIWFRGYCEFDKTLCKNAHGIEDLSPEAFLPTDPKPETEKKKLKMKLKIQNRNYRHYYEYQEILVKKGVLKPNEVLTLEEINSDNKKKLALRKIIQKDLACEFLKLLFMVNGKKEPFLQKTYCEKMLKKIGFNKLPSDIYNSEYFYEIKTTINENEKKFKATVVREADFIDLNQQTEEKLREIIEELLKHKKNLSISLINNAYYKKINPLDPPLTYFLRRRDQSFIEYLKELKEKKIVDFPENFNFENEEKVKRKLVFQEIEKFWLEKKEKHGICKKTTMKNEIEKKIGENGPFGKNEFDKFLFGSDNLMIHFHLGPFILNINECFLAKNDQGEKKTKKKCVLKNEKNLERSIFNDEKPKNIDKIVTLIYNFDSFENSAKILADSKVLAVDLEGNLSSLGAIDLIQIGVKEGNIERIFIFDIFTLKKEDYFEGVNCFLKEIFEDERKLKLFFDCQKDSLALHKFLNIHCENVIDLAAFHVLIESLSFFLMWKKQKIDGFETQTKWKFPNLNDILEKYQAKHGINPFKEEMKVKFATENIEHFQQRPIREDFLEYSAKDVEDLEDVYGKMMRKLEEIVQELEVKSDKDSLEESVKKISRKYVKQGCDI